ncbi:valyl-tRNA synthetase [Encephalitozoon romaleae SJ-2008]|uniref:Probable valine--tRNA ligase, cytoplasmic n=1 Tax=Encephalitozoon romaleae (strain SJ-2008) TaxID=1178016 RepID=I7AME9_ENCRO|nr:valyl-tRNA synthetase [Encephalitozoon romaleae SJ-2008]AFN82879.1 valyl-tRNA synthetase [Encephalitozoon romaleae SJ-2008]
MDSEKEALREKKRMLKEEKRKQKLEKFLAKKTQEVSVSKPKRDYKGDGYDPLEVESKWYRYWEEKGLFKPVEGGPKYIIPIPPPNVTGNLHIGHAMMVSIQDTLCRYKRMCGYEVLYIPGTDHAGIATQNVVSKQMEKEGIRVDREMFLKKAWEWKGKHGSRIYEQFKRLGTSVDFSRERFTLDPGMNEAVVDAFVSLYEKGLIYRELKIVNWCGKLSTTISDLEVNHEEVMPNTYLQVDGGKYEFGVIYHFRYPVTTDKEFSGDYLSLPTIEVATTRPETILGDTGICVNRKDRRFSPEGIREIFGDVPCECNIYGVNPLTREVIPVIFDDYADMSFGTGIVKITPAHDANDFDVSKRHNLACKAVLDEQNKVISEGEFKGMKRFEARKAVVSKLKDIGLFIEKKGYSQVIPRCSRSNDIIEPIIKSQWWLNCKEMAKRAIEAVVDGKIRILPEGAERQWYRWLENIRDWCLSRQLWWGHRIPAYRTPEGRWYVGRSKMDAFSKMKSECLESSCNLDEFCQDEDVLDTWFSSGLWPFAILGWPKKTDDFLRYYPNTLLETGSDILFFWVARMVMLGLELTVKAPFSQVFLHGIVRDAHGRKMSKSLGNVIDPIFVIDGCSLENLISTMRSGNLDEKEMKRAEAALRQDFPNGIPRCGADALRFTLLSYTSGMKDVNLDVLRVEGYRRFCNKIWNAHKFVKMMVDEIMDGSSQEAVYKKKYEKYILSSNDLVTPSGQGPIEWILKKRNEAIETIRRMLDSFNFMAATQAIHQFFIYDLCDVFIEVVKKNRDERYISTLLSVFIDSMKMLHPFMPFITEEVFSNYSNDSISVSSYPKVDGSEHENKFSMTLQIVKYIRAKAESNGWSKVSVEIVPGEDVCSNDLGFISLLCKKITEFKTTDDAEADEHEKIGGSRVFVRQAERIGTDK